MMIRFGNLQFESSLGVAPNKKYSPPNKTTPMRTRRTTPSLVGQILMTSANTKGLGGGFIDDGDGGGDDGGQVLGVPDRRSRCQDTNEIENSSTAVVIGHTNIGEGSETGSGHIFKQLFGHRREIDAPFVTTHGLTIQNTSVLCGKVKGGGFITKVDGISVETPNDLFRGPTPNIISSVDNNNGIENAAVAAASTDPYPSGGQCYESNSGVVLEANVNCSCAKRQKLSERPHAPPVKSLKEKQDEWIMASKQNIDGREYPDTVPKILADGSYKCPRVRKNKEWNTEFGYFALTEAGKIARKKETNCNVCGQSFKSQSALAIHYRTHTGERPFKCDICGVSFIQSCSLARHYRTHTGERPFECQVCNSFFSTKGILQVHQRTHNVVLDFKETRDQSLQNAAAEEMANDVVCQMRSLLKEGDGHIWYVGGGAADRSEVDDDNIPKCLSKNEIVAALFRPNAMVRGQDGQKLKAPQVRDHIKSGKLKFFVSRIDHNPDVCDNAERKAQSMLLEEHCDLSSVRLLAAGTVRTGSKVKENGYCIFGWIFFDVADDPAFSIVKFSQRKVVMPSQELVLEMMRNQKSEPTNSNPKICVETNTYPNCVRLQARGERRSRRVFISMVEGSRHIRIWGVPKYPEKWIRHESEYGEGNEQEAYLSHIRILKSKQTKSYAKRRGAYTILEDDDYFVTGEEASTEEELAEDQLILSHIDLALMNNILCVYEDEESDEDKDVKSV